MRRLFISAIALSVLTAGSAAAQMKPGAGSVKMETKQIDASASARRIKRDEAMRLVKADKAVYVDVRSKQSYDAGHIRGALSIPSSQLAQRVRELPPGKTIITYCACVEEHSAAVAVVVLKNYGIKNAGALVGGWNEWTAQGLPTSKNGK